VPNHYMCDIYRRLEQCGLSVLDKNNNIILETSQAYLKDNRGGLEVYVNLKGREDKGIVPPQDYRKVQNLIFHSLTTWYYKTDSWIEIVIVITLKKQDAAVIVYWGEDVGDVIFSYNQGFVWGSNINVDIISPVSKHGANHGPQIPTAKTSYSSNI